MSLAEPKAVYDGFTIIRRGIDSENAPSIIGSDQAAFAINTTFRGGFAKPRPGIKEITLTGDGFQLGKWQGAHSYIAYNGQPSIVACIGGSLVRFDIEGESVSNLSTPSGLTFPSSTDQVWMVQAETYLPIQNGSSKPLVWDGMLLREVIPIEFGGTELPVGKMMEFNNGRLWVAYPDLRTFAGGDLAYSITGSAIDVLSFTENQSILGGGLFAMPSSAGFITALKSVATQDSVVGQGPLQVFGETGTASITAPFDRETWQFLTSPIQTVSMLSSGPRSQEGCTSVNGDIWFRSGDGIRSFMLARRDQGTWANTPLSSEINRVLNRDDQNLLRYGSAVNFDNRLLVTASPNRAVTDAIEYGVVHRGLMVLDFNPVSGMFNRGQPAWEGIWTGLRILQILNVKCRGVDRCFLFALDDNNVIGMWELTTTNTSDRLDDRIEWVIETKAMGFSDQSESLKELSRVERWFDMVSGVVDYDIQYKPDSFWGWLDLDSGTVCATTDLCDGPGCLPSSPQLQYRPRKLSSAPDEECEEAVSKPYKNAFEFQFKITVNGSARIRKFRSVAVTLPENTDGGCFGDEACFEERGCEYDPWSYAIG